MYTQCPDCSTAFRVTAEILKQAAGKVRCGGCGNAFNALEFLSEHKPGPAPERRVEGSLPELKPDPGEFDDGKLPKSISAEQSAALLKTLDDLAGSDIPIEDTGVEWRVVDEDVEDEEDEGVTPDKENSPEDTGSIRWFIDDSPTPVDEQLSAEPGEIDAPEIFEEAAAGEQMRFDDDTPLPDDFDFDAERAEEPEPVMETRAGPAVSDTEQVDLALGEPEDWEDLLEEVDETEEPPARAEFIAESEDDLSARADAAEGAEDEAVCGESADPKPLPDVDEQFATQAEAMGIDLSGMRARLEAAPDEPADAHEPDVGETSIDDDLVAAAFEAEAVAKTARDEAADGDVDSAGVIDAATTTAEDESVADAIPGDDDKQSSGAAEVIEEEEFEIDLDFDAADLVEARDRELVSSTDEDAKLAAELGLDDDAPEDGQSRPEPLFLPESEEEKTVNMMIDQDLLAIAVEDEDGFATTIVQKQSDADDDSDNDLAEEPTESEKEDPLVETIIMEGEFIRDADEEEELERARQEKGDPNLKSAAAVDIREAPKKEEPARRQPVDYRIVAGIAALVIILVAQGIHQMRESLVTLPVVGEPLGSMYRAIGRPVTPDWDISGWRFEATKGSTDDNDAVLTIYSRVGNKSAEPLPYPLISVSLTDRYEDIIGSKVLEPGEYLADYPDTRRPVAPGDTFSAVISIDAPSAEATGFKLNVCYRQAGGKLKCAIDDFK